MFTPIRSYAFVRKAAPLCRAFWLTLTLLAATQTVAAAQGRVCVGGDNDGDLCEDNSECPGGTCAGFTPAPDRRTKPPDDTKPRFDRDCPPGEEIAPGKGIRKLEPNDPRDKNADGKGEKDYFMGEWKFVEGDKDLIVRLWCINKPRLPNGTFGDFFSYEVITSLKGKETEEADKKVAPTEPV